MLKELLRSKGVKQKWLANKIGVSEVSVSNWVKGKSEPTLKNYQKISEVLNIPLTELTN
ncbi:DNA-binding transcriptional regulator, XRE-family HTH domain [Algibacter lectus]|uniref:helix-turn-helix domain-containing protein n=1 Tax=Flavobacteriaceae TaxID=49546 RepID=UPI0008DF138E|nr:MULTISPECIES: helix-turn-helix transcriptional regulator [Flavobacteriaceae]SFD21229.1 DNA-binding transcriptional regulator, XRE-family HTH domain [Algibacter lectus]